MQDMNRTLKTYWPCSFCIWVGYLLSPFSFGLSFMLPNLCISEAKLGLIAAIERQNRIKLRPRGLHLEYKAGYSMSWLELSVVGPNEIVKTDNYERPTTATERDVTDVDDEDGIYDLEAQAQKKTTNHANPDIDDEE